MLARLSGALPRVFLGADDYTGSRLSAILPVQVLGLVSMTQGLVSFIAGPGQIVNLGQSVHYMPRRHCQQCAGVDP